MVMKTRRTAAIMLCAAAAAVLLILNGERALCFPLSAGEEMGRTLGLLSILPTALSLALAFVSGNVVTALLAGIVFGELMFSIAAGQSFAGSVIGQCVGTVSGEGNTQVLVLCVIVGGMVGVLRSLGGFEKAAEKIAEKINTPGKANLFGQLFCMCFFFDDYANALISGPVLQPLADGAGLSRERLAYIVDSTAAPLAGIAVVSSWVAVEISVIQEGLDAAGLGGSAFSLFVHSIPFCFYCIFAILLVLITGLTGREYGPMLEAERRARANRSSRPSDAEQNSDKGRVSIVISATCIAALVIYAVTALLLSEGETIEILLRATLCCSIGAVIAGSLFGIISVSEGADAFLEGASSIMPTVVVLVLAWSLAGVTEKLGTVYYVVDLISGAVPWQLVPALIFACCCLVSVAAGSYGCMFMVMPMAIPVATAVLEKTGGAPGSDFIVICIASVLTGGIFGDHCSPMTDCNILAALGSGCSSMRHAATQIPYALTVVAISLLCIAAATAGLNVWLTLLCGVSALTAIVLIFGKKV